MDTISPVFTSTTSSTDPRRDDIYSGSLSNDHSSGSDFSDNLALQIILAVAAAVVCSAVLIACAICYKSQKNAVRRKSVLGSVILGLDAPSPFSLPVSRQLIRQDAIANESYQGLNLVTERPQVDIEAADTSDDSIHSQTDQSEKQLSQCLSDPSFDVERPTLSPSCSAVNLDDETALDKRKLMRHSQSLGNIHSSFGFKDCDIAVSFSVEYDELNSVLRVTVESVSNLPLKAQLADFYAKACLYPINTTGLRSSVIKGDEIILLDELFLFQNIAPTDLERNTLRLSFYSRSRKRGKHRDNFIAECFLKCSDVDWKGEMPVQQLVLAQRKRSKKHSTSDKLLVRNLGELFVLLQFQPMANRIKVFLRRAQNLPVSDKMIVQPVYYVRINLLKADKIVAYKESRSQSGNSPAWNHPFLFDVRSEKIDTYCLEFVIMRGRFHTKDEVVGHVIIGPDGPKSGITHWREVMRPRAAEVAKWHNILPVFKY